MARRPKPMDVQPTTTMTRFAPRRPALYPDPADDPNNALPRLWEPFHEAYRVCGGSIAECYRRVTADWDHERNGNPPRIESLRARAKRENWRKQLEHS